MELKKMYKAGKQWIVAAAISVAAMGGATVVAKADTATPSPDKPSGVMDTKGHSHKTKTEVVPNEPAVATTDDEGHTIATATVPNEAANTVKDADGNDTVTASVPNDPAGTVTNADGSKLVEATVPNDAVQGAKSHHKHHHNRHHYQTPDMQPAAAPQSKSDMVPNAPVYEIQRPDTQPAAAPESMENVVPNDPCNTKRQIRNQSQHHKISQIWCQTRR